MNPSQNGTPPLHLRTPIALSTCLALAVGLDLALVWGRPGLWAGADLVPHLHLIDAVRQGTWLPNVYAPMYHWLGALFAPWAGPTAYPKAVAIFGALVLLAGFRSFQQAARLPDASLAIFALSPYVLSLARNFPRVEALGYGLLLFGLSAVLRRRHALLALLLGLTFYVHTASALLFGLAAGTLALASRDPKALLALAVGSLGAVPLVLAHTEAGCTIPEAMLFSRGGYSLSMTETRILPRNWPWILPLAGPIALVAAVAGAGILWRCRRPLAVLCAVLVLLYLNNLWLAPFGQRTLVTLLRGLSVLAIPVAVAAGVWAAGSKRRLWGVLCACSVWALVSVPWVIPHSGFNRPIHPTEHVGVQVSRCSFTWKTPRKYQTRSQANRNPGSARRIPGVRSPR
ncbi:hypothetical protein MK489_17395 [Myxococcota bacterium]|nr:hypothetical protein [Myxococcota bacterium]